jgi:hypothetical protein
MNYVANIAGVPVNLEWDSLPIESREFIINYGLKQYLQDGAAVSKTFTDKARLGEAKTVTEMDAEKAAGVESRIGKLKAGTVGERTRKSEPVDPIEKEMCRIVVERLRAKAKATGAKLPKAGTDEMEALIVAALEAHGDKLRAMAEKNLADLRGLDFDIEA